MVDLSNNGIPYLCYALHFIVLFIYFQLEFRYLTPNTIFLVCVIRRVLINVYSLIFVDASSTFIYHNISVNGFIFSSISNELSSTSI